jgi:hypothetical protein
VNVQKAVCAKHTKHLKNTVALWKPAEKKARRQQGLYSSSR